jgi:hypothetical protein
MTLSDVMPPLQAGHPVIQERQIDAKPCNIPRSVVTGSSAEADDDDRWMAAPATSTRIEPPFPA